MVWLSCFFHIILREPTSLSLSRTSVQSTAPVARNSQAKRFIVNENQIAQDALLSFEKRIVPVTIANTNDEALQFTKI